MSETRGKNFFLLPKENRDPLSAFCAIMDRILESDIEIPDEAINRLIGELERQL